MEAILYQLFRGEYDITPAPDKTQQELSNLIFAELDKVASVFGAEFVDHLCALTGELEQIHNFYYYRSGFRLCAGLVQDILTG